MSERLPNNPQGVQHTYPRVSPQERFVLPSSTSMSSPMKTSHGASYHRPKSRPPSGIGSQCISNLSSTSGSLSSGYGQQCFSSPMTPEVNLPGYQDLENPQKSVFGNLGAARQEGQILSPGPQSQKRAYRQRRKDPSCDACRERKVKCDATDSASCTECRSRNVSCQFTKETNKRMTSIKQNQDLAKELAQAQLQLGYLRTLLESGKHESPMQTPSMHHRSHPNLARYPDPSLSHFSRSDFAHSPQHLMSQEDSQERPRKKRKTVLLQDLAQAGSNMIIYGRGIFKSPHTRYKTTLQGISITDLPDLPDREKADALLYQYHSTFHSVLPILHWPSFQEAYNSVYKDRSLRGVSRTWVALLFAVFACGTLHRSWVQGGEYLRISRSLIDLAADNQTIDHARAALLCSIFLVESNQKSAGWTWIGLAVRISFDIELNSEASALTPIEQETRRRVWWSIYCCDCLLSLELGRPVLIRDEDYDVGLPDSIDDHYMQQDSDWSSPNSLPSKSALRPLAQVVRGIAKLNQLLKSQQIDSTALDAYEAHFVQCIADFSPQSQSLRGDYIDPIELPPIMYLQNARVMLHRHNMTPICEPKLRSAAIDSCNLVAKDTAKLLRRCMQEPPADSPSQTTAHIRTWENRMISSVSAFICTHIWRCTLFLCFRTEFEMALICARASAVLADARPVNIACGRYLEFFLHHLSSKLQSGVDLDGDEEMLTYLSADLQGSLETSWIWEKSSRYEHMGEHIQMSSEKSEEHRARGSNDIATSEHASSEWNGWKKILHSLDQLVHQQRNELDLHGQVPNQQKLGEETALLVSPGASTSSNRINIRDLI